MKLDTFLICDDIRSEAGNKLSVLGIYTDQVLFNIEPSQTLTWPQMLKISFYIRFSIESTDNISGPIHFKLYSETNGEKEQIGDGDIAAPGNAVIPSKIVLAANYMGYLVKGPGIVTYSIEFSDQAGRLLLANTTLGSMKFGEVQKE